MRIEAEALSKSDPAPPPGARECRRSTRWLAVCRATEQGVQRFALDHLFDRLRARGKGPPSFDERRSAEKEGSRRGRQSHGWHLFRQNSKRWIAPPRLPDGIADNRIARRQPISREGGWNIRLKASVKRCQITMTSSPYLLCIKTF